MSAGGFNLSKYELDDGSTIVPIRVQPETLAFTNGTNANGAPTGAVTLNVTAYARKSKRQYGIGARTVSISWNAGAPDGYKDDNVIVPILSKAVFDGYSIGDVVTYLGTAATIVSKTAEVLT